MLKEITKKILFIPVTTRSIEQYQGINWIEGTAPKFAVASNDANLICQNKIDSAWQQDFYRNIQPYAKELHAQQMKLAQNKNFSICRIVDGSFLFLKCVDEICPEKIFAAGDSAIDVPMLKIADVACNCSDSNNFFAF